jgi:hypothetical protein
MAVVHGAVRSLEKYDIGSLALIFALADGFNPGCDPVAFLACVNVLLSMIFVLVFAFGFGSHG